MLKKIHFLKVCFFRRHRRRCRLISDLQNDLKALITLRFIKTCKFQGGSWGEKFFFEVQSQNFEIFQNLAENSTAKAKK